MFSRSEITALMDATPAPGVSLFFPTRKFGRETRQNPIALKNLLSDVQAQLAAQDMPQAEIEALLAPATAMVDDHDFWQAQDLGLALFLADGSVEVHKLPVPVPERAVVGHAFHIAPLLPLLDGDAPFVVLTATAEGATARLATRFAMTDLAIKDMPASVEALDLEPDYEGNVQSHGFGRPNSGGHSMPKTQVYGDSPEEWRKGRLVEYARRIASAVAARLARNPMPVAVIADAEMGGHLAKSDALGPLIAGHLDMNPASQDDEALHEAAWGLMRPLRHAERDAALERLNSRLGQADGTATTDAALVVKAAHEGRVEAVFLARDAVLRGRFNDQDGTAQIARDGKDGGVDLMDMAARLTLRAGGDVRVVDADMLPEQTPLAATLRY